jgi:hypothetical protein
MKKIILVLALVVVAVVAFTGVAAAQTTQPGQGTLHDYMQQALADKLGIPVADVEAQFDAGVSFYQIALNNQVDPADISTFMEEVRTDAINAALADGVITQAQADWMLVAHGHGMGVGNGAGRGYGMMGNTAGSGSGVGPCGGTGTPVGTGMQRGGRWGQVNP